jgi:DNA polymerase III delta prime subunit
MDNFIWFEKYRPRSLDEMVLSPENEEAFNQFIEDEEIPHLLLYGPAGSGKTTLSQIIISHIAANSLKLNASSADRGVNVIKKTVKDFAASKPRKAGLLNIVFFDEAHGLTPDAQDALPNTMETYSQNCRFIFTCNYIDKIVDPIKSRCQIFKFETFPKKYMIKHCRNILRREKVKFTRTSLKIIVDRYYPDARSIINNLQACSIGGQLSERFLDRFDPNDFLRYLSKGKIFALRNMWANTLDFTTLYKFLFNHYADSVKNKELRADMMIMIAEYMWKDKNVADREINFTACVLEIMVLQEMDIDFVRKQ